MMEEKQKALIGGTAPWRIEQVLDSIYIYHGEVKACRIEAVQKTDAGTLYGNVEQKMRYAEIILAALNGEAYEY